MQGTASSRRRRASRATAGPGSLRHDGGRAYDAVLAPVLPGSLPMCWFTLDPATLLVTSHVNTEMPELPIEWLADEYYADDVHHLADVARSPRGISTLHDATGGDPSSSARWHENMRYGGDQEVIAALRTSATGVWGALGVYRPPGAPLFTPHELTFLQSLSPVLADGARRALARGEAADPDPDDDDAPAVITLDERWDVESSTPRTAAWLADFPDGDADSGRLPAAVLSVAGRAAGDRAGAARARVRGRSGRWMAVHGDVLRGPNGRRVVVVIEAAHPARLAPLLMAAYGLTAREQEVAQAVLGGASTAEIAAALHLSPLTVQQHLKSVFDKTGVRSRRDLVGMLFFAHYEPRLRDNEQRALAHKPLRGGPVPAQRHR